MSDIVLFIDWLYRIDLFSSIAASVFNKLAYFTLLLLSVSVSPIPLDQKLCILGLWLLYNSW